MRLLAQAEGNRVLADGEDLTSFLHTPEVDRVVSAVARLPGVRAWVNRRLKEVPPPFVAEGRDMGTAVFPEAAHKFYLTASPEVRAWRRAREGPRPTRRCSGTSSGGTSGTRRKAPPLPTPSSWTPGG